MTLMPHFKLTVNRYIKIVGQNLEKLLIYVHCLGFPPKNVYHPASGRVGRVTDYGVRGLGFKSPGSILTSRTETSSLSRVVRDGWDASSVPVSGQKNSPLRWSLRLGRWTATTVQKTTLKQTQKQISFRPRLVTYIIVAILEKWTASNSFSSLILMPQSNICVFHGYHVHHLS